jgi:hypothetical protein
MVVCLRPSCLHATDVFGHSTTVTAKVVVPLSQNGRAAIDVVAQHDQRKLPVRKHFNRRYDIEKHYVLFNGRYVRFAYWSRLLVSANVFAAYPDERRLVACPQTVQEGHQEASRSGWKSGRLQGPII